MKKESRVKNSLLNLRIVWVWQLAYMIIKFLTRRIFSQAMPTEYLGTEAVFTNIIGILDLAELGITTAVTSALYLPLSKRDEDGIADIMTSFAYLYKVIAILIAGIGLIITPFITLISSELDGIEYVHLTFIFYIVSSVFGYIFGYKSVLLAADQKNYLFVRNHYVCIIFQNFIQIIVLIKTKSFIFYVLVMLFAKAVEYINISRITNKRYPFICEKRPVNDDIKNSILQNVKRVAIGKIGNSLIQSTDSIIITNILGLYISGLYSNYYLLISSAMAIIIQFPYALTASIGNMVAENDETKINDMFWVLYFLNTSVFAFASIGMGAVIQPVINVWVGHKFELAYYNAIAFIVVFYLTGVRSQLNTYKTAKGLFQYESLRSIFECSVNLIVSVVLAKKVGLIGVSLGTIISSLFVGLPIELFNLRLGYKINLKRFAIGFVYYGIVMSIAWYATVRVTSMVHVNVLASIVVNAIIATLVFGLIWVAMLFKTKSFQMTFNYLKKYLSRNK